MYQVTVGSSCLTNSCGVLGRWQLPSCRDMNRINGRKKQKSRPGSKKWRHLSQCAASRDPLLIDELLYLTGHGSRILAKALALVATGFVTGSMMSILARPVVVQQSLAQEAVAIYQPAPVMDLAQNFVRSSTPRQGKRDVAQRQAIPSIKDQVNDIQRLNAAAKQATNENDFSKALGIYTEITQKYPDLAITNYARINRALLLYQTGNKSEAILELEGLEASLRGYAEVHAALAAIIYSERPSEITYAEEQFDLASEFDRRYADVEWVSREKHWPPAMVMALDRFANLKS